MSRRELPGKWTARRDANGVSILCNGVEVHGISMSELKSVATIAATFRHLSGKPWQPELFAKIWEQICVLLRVP